MPTPKLRILLVDDTNAVRELLNTVLTAAGHTVTCATNGKAGVAMYQKGKCDLVITDYDMPEMDGGEMTSIIRVLNPKQPVLWMSGEPFAGKRLTLAETLKVKHRLNKPFTPSALMDMITSMAIKPE